MIRPAVPADFDQFGERPPARVKAWVMEHDGEVLGIGGLLSLPNGTWAGFLDLKAQAATRFPKSLHRAARAFLEEQRRVGVRCITATADLQASSAAERWLLRLGFCKANGTEVFVCRLL